MQFMWVFMAELAWIGIIEGLPQPTFPGLIMLRPIILQAHFNNLTLQSWHIPQRPTSGKFEQILEIASRTWICVSENTLVSISVFARLEAEAEIVLNWKWERG